MIFALLVALATAAVAAVAYGTHAGLVTLAIAAPLGVVTAALSDWIASRDTGLRLRFGAVAALAALMAAVAVALFVTLMFVSRHDALMTALLVTYAAALALWVARRITRRALRDLETVRATLGAVGHGRRDARTGLAGDDEIAQLGRDVDAMIARLDREERARRTMFAAVSHDLRTPITALGLLAAAIDDEVVEPTRRREYAARINTHVAALAALIDDLFELTRLQSEELTWTMERVRMDELLHAAVEAMRPQANAGAVLVRAELQTPLNAPRGNPEQLQRVLFNLIQNAIRHTPPDGSVTVRAEGIDGAVEVEVADTGNGIPAGAREHVFEPFYRADAARHDPGAGLGLAISRAIVEAHGGVIWLEDAPVGTRVRFR
ncbi:MAG TPA: HAMP domain-containing sensor histidine kinase, partial [Solirubrobacter sp.]|nr:HAMP domain-containing sensor histidine kinase [Solirubrobacter sp.]